MTTESSPTPTCLGEQVIHAFARGTLSGDARADAEGHIAQCAACRAALADTAVPSTDAPPPDVSALILGLVTGDSVPDMARTPSYPAPGDVLADKYRIEHAIGRGAMGCVFAARHVELGSRVAVKVLFRTDEASVARFLREARTCAHLAGENLVRVFDIGRLPNGIPYLVMEYLTGSDLGSLVSASAPVPISDAVGYVMQACIGLAEAHAAGVVHRDLKPANLFLTARADGSPLVKVLDFGVSKTRVDDPQNLDVSLTRSQSLVGTPVYMSPEQLKNSKDVDARTDIWSLGVILYQLITHQFPFPIGAISSLSIAIATDVPPPPSSFRSEVPAGLDACILRCLEKNREHRYASVNELRAALGVLVSPHEPASEAAIRRAPNALARALLIFGVAAAILAVVIAARRWSRHPEHETAPPTPSASANAPLVASASPSASAAPPSAERDASVLPTPASSASPSAPASGKARPPSRSVRSGQPRARGPMDTPD